MWLLFLRLSKHLLLASRRSKQPVKLLVRPTISETSHSSHKVFKTRASRFGIVRNTNRVVDGPAAVNRLTLSRCVGLGVVFEGSDMLQTKIFSFH